MKFTSHLAAALATVLLCSAAVAAENAPAAQASTAEAPKKVKKTCVREQVSGSNRIKRVCYTQGEEAVRSEIDKGMDDIGRISATGAGGN